MIDLDTAEERAKFTGDKVIIPIDDDNRISVIYWTGEPYIKEFAYFHNGKGIGRRTVLELMSK